MQGECQLSVDLSVSLGGLDLANPIMPASGCFGPELAPLIDLSRLGAVVTKTIFSDVRAGNPAHRLAETANGMLNSVGIPSKGIDFFLQRTLPAYRAAGVPVIVSLGGLTVGEYWDLAEVLAEVDGIAAFELNISCPNLEAGGLEIGANPAHVERVVRGVVDRVRVPVISKLTPNITSITDISRASEAGGASALTVANTIVGMAVDVRRRRPILGNVVGGLSGPAIKPAILRLVWTVARETSLPIIGCGGISNARDVLEFMIVGASAVQVGTATFTRPDTMIRILDELGLLLEEQGVHSVMEVCGTLETDRSTAEALPEMALSQSNVEH